MTPAPSQCLKAAKDDHLAAFFICKSTADVGQDMAMMTDIYEFLVDYARLLICKFQVIWLLKQQSNF